MPSGGPPEKTSVEPPELKVSLTKPSPGVVDFPVGALVKIEIDANRDLLAAPVLGKAKLITDSGEDITKNLLLITLVGKRTLLVDIDRATPSGTYTLDLLLRVGSNDGPVEQWKQVKIVLSRSS